MGIDKDTIRPQVLHCSAIPTVGAYSDHLLNSETANLSLYPIESW